MRMRDRGRISTCENRFKLRESLLTPEDRVLPETHFHVAKIIPFGNYILSAGEARPCTLHLYDSAPISNALWELFSKATEFKFPPSFSMIS